MKLSRQVRLRLKALTFVSTEQDFERGPTESTLVIDMEAFDKMVAWAESKGWKAPGRSLRCRHIPRAIVPVFLNHLRNAVAEPAVPRGRRARFDPDGPLREFFAKSSNKRQLVKAMKLLEAGGELVVEDE
jgi:hypothetical protein